MSNGVAGKRVFIKSYGCQMNVYDSDRMADVLRPLGYALTETSEDADLVILNTCHIRERATEKVYSELGRAKAVKIERAGAGKATLIAVAGCVAQAQGAEIIRRQPAVDLVVGPQSYHRLPEMIARAHRSAGERLATDFEADAKFDALPIERAPGGVSAFLTVQEGCDRFCTFCVVPYTRGAEYSRPVEDIVVEARGLVSGGVREITLLGQNVNAYKSGEIGLAGLIRRLAAIPSLARIRYTTSHPADMGDDLIAAHGEVGALMPYLHLPVQSGSDRILKAMNRAHTTQSYKVTVERLRHARPDLALSSDFIVGFPGETEADFAATMDLIREVRFASAFSFKYSRRPGTPASAMAAQIDKDVKTDRLARLQELLKVQQREFNASMTGRTLDVLVEKPGRHEGQVIGRSPYLQAVHFEGSPGLIGRVVPARALETV